MDQLTVQPAAALMCDAPAILSGQDSRSLADDEWARQSSPRPAAARDC